jgi:hypothetical protein
MYFNCSRAFRMALLMVIVWPASLLAQFQQPQQEEKELSPVSRTYAITNVNIVQSPGRKIEKGIVIIKNGLIHSVGKNISVPSEALIIKGDSLHVYAGFIDGLSRVGITKPKEEPNRERPKDPGNPQPEVAGITPYNDVRLSLNPTDKTIDELRAQGFTVAQIVPYGMMMPGNAAIVMLSGKSADEMTLVGKSALYSELTGAQRVYPNTVIAVMAKWRELYRQASQAKNYEAMYASNRSGLARPASDRILEAFYPVIEKKQPVLFESDKYLKTQRILNLQSDLGFSLLIGDVKEGWDAIPKLKSSSTRVFLSLDLPEEIKKDKKDTVKTKTDEKPKDPETLALEKRREEAIALYAGQASTFQKAGMSFGFSSLTVKVSDIRANLRRMIAAGLTEDQALAALTTNAAQLLGLSDRLGSVDAGKIANLVLTDKPYFDEKAKVRYVFVDGVIYKYDPKEASKAESAGVINVAGTWTVITETNQGKHEEKLTIKKDGSTYSGSLTGGRFTEAVSLEQVELNGNKLKYSYTTQAEGQSMKVDVEVTIEGDAFKGTAVAGRFGTFPVEGKKDPNR